MSGREGEGMCCGVGGGNLVMMDGVKDNRGNGRGGMSGGMEK